MDINFNLRHKDMDIKRDTDTQNLLIKRGKISESS
jgi:hypothetical protein